MSLKSSNIPNFGNVKWNRQPGDVQGRPCGLKLLIRTIIPFLAIVLQADGRGVERFSLKGWSISAKEIRLVESKVAGELVVEASGDVILSMGKKRIYMADRLTYSSKADRFVLVGNTLVYEGEYIVTNYKEVRVPVDSSAKAERLKFPRSNPLK